MQRTASLFAGLALLAAAAGCGEPTTVTESAAPQVEASQAQLGAAVNRDLAALRRATAPFHNFDKAVAAGWSAKITSCMELAGVGGMGFHYGNVGLIDGSVQADKPELLLYEPEQNGKLRLVAVEYIIPYTFHARDAAPPTLFGQPFQQNDTFQLWGLHAWVWENNPSGIFASWNPRVDCSNTTDVMAM